VTCIGGVVILALDASLGQCSAAVVANGIVIAQRIVAGERGHAATLPPLAQAVLREAGIMPAALSAIAAVVGPGGFTGIRAALALAEGLALAAGLPLLGVTTGEALAAALPDAQREARAVWSAIDNRRGRVVLERFLPHPLPAEACEITDLPPAPGPIAVVGDAAPAVAEALRARGVDVLLTDIRLPEAGAAGRVATLRLAGALPPRAATPLYVEPPAVRLPG